MARLADGQILILYNYRSLIFLALTVSQIVRCLDFEERNDREEI